MEDNTLTSFVPTGRVVTEGHYVVLEELGESISLPVKRVVFTDEGTLIESDASGHIPFIEYGLTVKAYTLRGNLKEIKMVSKELVQGMFRANNQVTVKFTKKNGDERTMVCTQSLGMIPEKFHPKSDTKKKVNEDVCNVYELGVGWRSFRYDSVLEIS